MAQHISLINSDLSKMKGYQKVVKSITDKINIGFWRISGSLRFEEIKDEGHKMTLNDRVFVTERTVNGRREWFELHYDVKEEKILEIFRAM